jgi:hypothetical protein
VPNDTPTRPRTEERFTTAILGDLRLTLDEIGAAAELALGRVRESVVHEDQQPDDEALALMSALEGVRALAQARST